MPYKKLGDKKLASAITSCIVLDSDLKALPYDNGVRYRITYNILQAESIRKKCGQGRRAIHTSSNFSTFLGDLAPSGIESDRSDRHGQSTRFCPSRSVSFTLAATIRSASSCGGTRRTQLSQSGWSPTIEREKVKVRRPTEKKGMERPSNRYEYEHASSKTERGDIRVTMEPRTTKDTMG